MFSNEVHNILSELEALGIRDFELNIKYQGYDEIFPTFFHLFSKD